jgi:chromosome partitioning protein
MIILVGGEKGGTGKTTFAVNFAVMRQIEGGDVILIDAEQTQPNASNWCVLRDSNNVLPRITSVQKLGKNLRSDILSLKKKYQDIVIDTGGQDTIELRSGLIVADIAISPLRPSQFDLWTLAKLDKLVGEVKIINERLKFLVFLNQASPNPHVAEIDDARKYFEEAGFEHIQLANTVIYERIAFRKMANSGSSVNELGIDKKAEAEINALYQEALS